MQILTAIFQRHKCGIRYHKVSEDAYSKAIELEPDNHFLYCNKGDLYTKQKRLQDALEQIKKSVALNPKYDKRWYVQGYVLKEMKKWTEAPEAYHKVIDLDHQSGWI